MKQFIFLHTTANETHVICAWIFLCKYKFFILKYDLNLLTINLGIIRQEISNQFSFFSVFYNMLMLVLRFSREHVMCDKCIKTKLQYYEYFKASSWPVIYFRSEININILLLFLWLSYYLNVYNV